MVLITADGTLYTWFAESAARYPDHPALKLGQYEVCYAELLELAERVATRLALAAASQPRVVGLCASRGLATYVGYLAALRLSATVVPIGPDVPAERKRQICASAGVAALIVDEAGRHGLAEVMLATSVTVLELPAIPERGWYDELPARWAEPIVARPNDIAYTVFTSGSTGVPKGVPIRHRNLGAYFQYVIDRYQVGPGCRLSHTFELTFDPSVFDMFVSWLSGAVMVVAQRDDLLAPVRYVNDHGITHWFSIPTIISLARRLRLLRPACMPNLRWSLFAGDRLTLDQARIWADAAPASVVENLYGPTELTITCTQYRLPADRARWPATTNNCVPIGQVYPHLDAVVLDAAGAATDGELWVRGCQRFDGYVDPSKDPGRFLRSEATAATAVDGRPDADDWFGTGDHVRLEDGELVHLGRLDDQVKVNGYRVELGDVESVLRQHPGVLDVVVLAVSAGPDEVELLATYTGDGIDQAQLVAAAAQRLPAYMLPRRYYYVDRLPMTAHGKIDRRRLASELGSAG